MPDGIDVIMYDAVMRDALIEGGWIQPIDPGTVQDAEDIFPFALEDFAKMILAAILGPILVKALAPLSLNDTGLTVQ